MMTSVVEKSSMMKCGTHKSKRKVRAYKGLRDSMKANTPEEFFEKSKLPNYGLRGVCKMCGDCKSDQYFRHSSSSFQGEEDSDGASKEEIDEGILDFIDWCDSARSELQSLVMCNLDAAFKIALKRIVACGYSEEVATKAVMSPGICYGPKDTLSNIADNTLKFLKTCKANDLKGHSSCMDLKELEDYLMAEFLYVFRVIRPFSSPGDMLWYLLVSDLNVSDACAVVFGRYDISEDMDSNVSSHPLPKNQLDDAYRRLDMDLDPPLLHRMPPSAADFQREISSWGPNMGGSQKTPNINKKSCGEEGAQSSINVVDWSFVVSKTSQRLEAKGKLGSSRNIQISGTIKRESNFGQKLHHVNKRCQTHGYNKSILKQGKFFGLTIDKKNRSAGEFYPKHASMKVNKAVEVKGSEDKTKPNCSVNKGDMNPASSLCGRCAASSLPPVSSPNSNAVSPRLKRVPSQASRVGPVDYSSCKHGVTRIKDANGQSIKPDEKTEMIYQLLSKIYMLKDQLEQWTEWTNSRVMQATLRLTKHKEELNVLRQEKKDPEKLKQSIEESTLRKLSEIENALSKANIHAERANGAFRVLEFKNSALKRETEAAKLEAAESAVNCHDIAERERKAMSSVNSLDKQKSSLQEELISLKQTCAHTQKECLQARDVLTQLEANREHELEVTKDLQLKASSIKMEMEQGEALRKYKEDAFRSKAEINLQKYKDDIKMLQKQVVKLSLSRDATKTGTRASRVPSSTHKSPMFPDALLSHLKKETQKSDKKSAKDVKRDKECVMCLSEENSVVFLPCAHQAICAKCNELHEKNGMKDCPSCRSVIQHRVVVRYHVP